jgi:hypothetical protein
MQEFFLAVVVSFQLCFAEQCIMVDDSFRPVPSRDVFHDKVCNIRSLPVFIKGLNGLLQLVVCFFDAHVPKVKQLTLLMQSFRGLSTEN